MVRGVGKREPARPVGIIDRCFVSFGRGASAAVVTALLVAHGTVDKSAFHGCEALKTISIPEGVQVIGPAAFDYCDALTTVTLPRSLEGQMEGAELTTDRIPGLKVTFT